MPLHPAERPELATMWEELGREPSDLDARRVLAEALDPDWRAFVHLQLAAEARALTPAEQRHHDDLLRRHRIDWVGPVRPWIDVHRAVFRRGFLDLADARGEGGASAGWRTVRQLSGPAGLLGRPCLDHLQVAGTRFVARPGAGWTQREGGVALDVDVLLALRGIRLPWRTIQLLLRPDTWEALTGALDTLDLPALEHVCVAMPETAPGAAAALGRQLTGIRELTVATPLHLFPLWERAARSAGVGVLRLFVHDEGGYRADGPRWELERGRAGWSVDGPVLPMS